MVSALPGSDPGSVSRLGGTLRSAATVLAGDAAYLRRDTPLVTLCEATAARLDEIGSALQVHAQDLAETAAALSRLHERASAAGLAIDGWSVIEPFGLVSAQAAAARQVQRPQLQAQADRIASQLARARAQLARRLTHAEGQLAAAAALARE